MEKDNIPEKVKHYETFLNETLRTDLKKVLDERDEVYGKISDYLQLKTVIERIKEGGLDKDELKTKVDLGCNFYVQAKVPDASKIFVSIGYGFYLEFTLDEAVKFIGKKIAQLTSITEDLTKDSAKIKAHMKLVLEALREIQHIDEEESKPQRELYT